MTPCDAWARCLILFAAATGATGCVSDLLEVDIPTQVDVEHLNDPANVQFVMAGTVGEFECGFSGYAATGGLMGWELDDARWWNGLGLEIDRRTLPPGGFSAAALIAACGGAFGAGLSSYVPLAKARWQADDLLTKLKGWTDEQVPGRGALIAKAAAYAGYSRVLLGEGMCTVAFDTGPELQPAQVFAQAEAMFTEALAGTPATDILNMARVGRARARLDLGRYDDAAADAALVPVGFVKTAGYSTASTRRENAVFDENNFNGNNTVNERYRPTMMQFQGVPDPRVPVVNANKTGFNGVTPLWTQMKYPSKSAAMRVATWDEAQLIIAEARWRANDEQATVAIINTLHSRTTPALPAFQSTSRQEIWDQLMYERRAALFLETHHLGDIRRYDWPLYPGPGTRDENGIVYGDQRCLPLPDIERNNNPNLSP
jgi:starch-binding outer membrane protein, SusD/RagB family